MKNIHWNSRTAGVVLALGALSASLSLVGCGNRSSGYVPQKPEEKPPVDLASVDRASLLPLKEGNEWTYEVTMSARLPDGNRSRPKEEVTLRVVRVETNNGETRAELEVVRNSTPTGNVTIEGEAPARDRTGWMVNAQGIFQTASGSNLTMFNPPLAVLLFDVAPLATQDFEGTGPRPNGTDGFFIGTYRTLGPQPVDTLSETVQAYGAESTIYFTDGSEPPRRPAVPEESAQLSNEPMANDPATNTPTLSNTPETTTTEEPTSNEPASTEGGETTGPVIPASQFMSLTQLYFQPGVGIVRFRQVNRQPDGIIVEQVFRLKLAKVN